MSWTSKCRMLSTRRPASRTTANASGRRSSSVSPLASALPELGGLAAQLVVGERLDRRLERVDRGDERAQALQLALVLRADDLREESINNHSGTNRVRVSTIVQQVTARSGWKRRRLAQIAVNAALKALVDETLRRADLRPVPSEVEWRSSFRRAA